MEKYRNCEKSCEVEIAEIQDYLEYDFKNLELSLLAQKIKSQTLFRPKPRMLFY